MLCYAWNNHTIYFNQPASQLLSNAVLDTLHCALLCYTYPYYTKRASNMALAITNAQPMHFNPPLLLSDLLYI